ncbi:rhodanese-like domain-containing protein [Helicobacter burdigaliensis]|uniref:rhodanese-like domain-containing protein n=1 Tax=Helicobacter burdigaliensis TaxID=2315334 RepID=UPI000EF6C9BF|nr:rhodanese-like domain-containing protein [Helicobacter burdigaliensis]
MEYYGKRHKSLAKAVFKEDLKDILEDTSWVLIDIREEENYLQGHLKNARNIVTQEEFYKTLNENKDKKILLNCYSGHTVSLIGSSLVDEGYTNIYFLDEEISDCL